ncbi:ShlB/FhaC/HecB family hemolysin secretion/activation protein [Roseobacter sp. HKCCA0434]|uniref:ShlB/FhaC/HecB family hemolysin secretion/activation protein n=1 Tax=Roseobacter sp. HKCCA0434 TaxID=3079297 RepID=UPI002905844D|nr:ShlB/FhaC/HecB family hemolysin secretion/activation protein [Roseobacter sp. HKCCA0434]
MQIFRVALVAIGMASAGFPIVAQEADQGARLLEETLREREIEALARSQAGQEISTPDIEGPVAETPCFPVDTITVMGNTVYTEAELASVVSAFSGQCLGETSIGNLLAGITALYADAGYITTRAYVPSQDLSTGGLSIDVLEGRIEAYEYQRSETSDMANPDGPLGIGSVMPQRPEEVFQLRDLEHGLEQMNRLRSTEVNANLIAGEAPGTSRIVLTETRVDAVRGTFGINTQGDEITGRRQVSFGLEADNLLSLYDTWSLRYSGSRDSNALAFGVSAPYRRWLFSLNGSYSEELTPVTANSDLFTQTANANLTVERLLFRDARSKYFAHATLSSYWNERYINIAALTPQHRSAFRVGLRQEHRFEDAVILMDTALSVGTGALGADRDASNLPAGSPRTDFTALDASLTYIRPLENGRQLSVSAVGKLSNRPLFGNEQLSIGGWNSVRGYEGSGAGGDNGLYVRTELAFPTIAIDADGWTDFSAMRELDLFRDIRGGIRPFAFLDAGYVHSRATERDTSLAGAGIGISAQLGRTTLNATLATPLLDADGHDAGSLQAYIGIEVKAF